MEPEQRFEILNRDGYRCQNKGCKYQEPIGITDSNLEIHHLVEREKFRANLNLPKELGYVMDDPQNLATLCTTCHRRYHCGVIVLCVKGKKYEVDLPQRFNWRHFKKEMKQLRREYRHLWNKQLSAEEFVILIVWLFGLD